MDLCRLCFLKISPRFCKDIFLVQQNELPIVDILKKLVDLNINESDRLPRIICFNCYKRIEDTYKFQQLILATDTKFQYLFNTTGNNENLKLEIMNEINIVNNEQNEQFNNFIVEEKIEFNEHRPIIENYNNGNKIEESWKLANKSLLQTPNPSTTIGQRAQKRTQFVCNTCGKQFTYKHNLTVHLNVHTGRKPYKCEICNRRFSAQSNLTNHKITHTNKKRFQCNLCKKWFGFKQNLLAHLNIHSGNKPYQCNICDKKFTAYSNLKMHTRIHMDHSSSSSSSSKSNKSINN